MPFTESNNGLPAPAPVPAHDEGSEGGGEIAGHTRAPEAAPAEASGSAVLDGAGRRRADGNGGPHSKFNSGAVSQQVVQPMEESLAQEATAGNVKRSVSKRGPVQLDKPRRNLLMARAKPTAQHKAKKLKGVRSC